MKTPKFKINDVVNHKPDLYGETESTVTEIGRLFRNEDGLSYEERHIDSLIPEINAHIENINGEDFLVMEEYMGTGWCFNTNKMSPKLQPKEVIPFYAFSVSTTNKKMNTLWNEKSLILK